MHVYKFGGASIAQTDRIQNVATIVKNCPHQPLLLVVSAMGKTTNALEKVATSFFEGNNTAAIDLFEQVKNQHIVQAKYLLVKHYLPFIAHFNDICTEITWILNDKAVQSFDYYYDQIVAVGELMSTLLISYVLQEAGVAAHWLDVRDLLRTDSNFRDAAVDWEVSQKLAEEQLLPILMQQTCVVTQGFIGCTSDNETTTLGREGSDYTAAIFAHIFTADEVVIWKDVDAVLSADPKLFKDAIPLPALSYDEVIEMAYYGAQVIHPKTIKPLFAKNIPLKVKSFLDPILAGTLISSQKSKHLPPMLIQKNSQVLMVFRSKDYSFVGEKLIGQWYKLLEQLRMKPNLTQNGAIQLMAVFDDHSEKTGQLAALADTIFDVQIQRNLTLFTIRHYDDGSLTKHLAHHQPLLTQKTLSTLQVLLNMPLAQ